jgi:UDP-glucose 4-epimerase
MKILITGGSGFIGRNLVEQYSSRYEVMAPTRSELDLLDAASVERYLKQHRFDYVIHAATERSNRSLPDQPELLDRTCRMFFNLARCKCEFGRMLFLSSGAIYDRAHWHPRMSEAYFDRFVPADDYGFAKYICAKAIPAMDDVYEMRLFGVFGPHEEWRVRFVSNACCRAMWGLPIVIRQNVLFDYMDVEDLGSILEAFLHNRPRHRQYNICTGRSSDLVSVARMVLEASAKNLEIVIRNEGLGREYSGDNSRLLEQIPDLQFREMSGSVARLYRWYESRRNEIDRAQLDFDW